MKETIKEKVERLKEIEKTNNPYSNYIFISQTRIRGVIKDRWECPKCKSTNSESRFNLGIKKRESLHSCRFCKKFTGWLRGYN